RPAPETIPTRAQMFWTAAMSGKVSSAVQSVCNPSVAPATAYVPMPLGSSSDAPVMKPGPRILPIFLAGLVSDPISAAVPAVAPDGGECGMTRRRGLSLAGNLAQAPLRV